MEIDPQQEEAFHRRQRRKLAIGWTLMGAGTALALQAVWLSRSGDDVSDAFKRGVAVTVTGAAMVIAGGGVLINRRLRKNEHDGAIQMGVGPASISIVGRF
ncbi:MAG: hypothetical protein WBM46_11025 [Polyangiales bacterium]